MGLQRPASPSVLATHLVDVLVARLDWSERRQHLAGSVGAALLGHFIGTGWARRIDGTRVVAFTPSGESRLRAWCASGDNPSGSGAA